MATPDTHARAPEADLTTADELNRQLIRFVRLIHRAKSQVAKQGPDGIERAAYAILFTLVHDGPQRTSRLAESLHSDISTISRQSSALVQHGLIKREADPSDGRATLLAATSAGVRVFEENRKQRNEWLAAVLADWSSEDRVTLAALLDRLNADVEANLPEPEDKGDQA